MQSYRSNSSWNNQHYCLKRLVSEEIDKKSINTNYNDVIYRNVINRPDMMARITAIVSEIIDEEFQKYNYNNLFEDMEKINLGTNESLDAMEHDISHNY